LSLSTTPAANCCAATQEFPNFYETRWFITVITRGFQWSPSRARPIRSTPPHTISSSFDLNVIHLLLVDLPSGLIPSAFPSTTHTHSYSLPFVLHALPISSSLVSSIYSYLMKRTSYEALHYPALSSLISLRSNYGASEYSCAAVCLYVYAYDIGFTL
jgi:hypothetical protein